MYSNENEQVDALKNFFAQNGKALVVGLVMGIGILAGWRYWNHHQDDSGRETSATYQRVIGALDNHKPETLNAAAAFADKNANSYGVFASLDLARQYVDSGKLDNAVAQLQKALASSKEPNLQSVIALRLARLQLQQKKPDEAIKALEHITGDAWVAIVADVRGEALLSKGDVGGARTAWSKGIASDATPALKEMLQMKMHNLPG